MNQPPLCILVIGAGRFGRQQLAEWGRLAGAGEVELSGVVVTSEHTREQVQRDFGVPAWSVLTDDLLRDVHAVDIVTPPATHAALIRRCLPFTPVLVEKPIATDATEAADLAALAATLGRVLMVGHLYRFHRRAEEACGRNPGAAARHSGYPNQPGGRGDRARRDESRNAAPVRHHRLSLRFRARVSTRNNQLHKRFFPGKPRALRDELQTFIASIRQPARAYHDATVGTRIVRVAQEAHPRPATRRPRIAVIGGGIFGAACALELAAVGDVTIFERRADVLTETSATNQRRHHSGFHYPRSCDTILEIRAAREAFEAEFGEAVDRSIPAYYCTSATGVEIPAERYVAACQSNHLASTIVHPPADVVDPSAVSVCLRTDEAVSLLGFFR